MFSLILAFLTIAFLSALAVVAINYTPWWLERAQTAHQVASEGLPRLVKAYELATAAGTPADTPIAPAGGTDGGLVLLFSSYYGFLPMAPRNMDWVYGHQAAEGAFLGMDYICLRGTSVEYGEYLGVQHLADTLGSAQAILADTCGASAPMVKPSSYPTAAALTFYMQYVPGV